MQIVDDDHKRLQRINSIWAFISLDDSGGEGVMAFQIGDRWFPMIAADEKRLDSLRPLAEQVAMASGKTAVLARFETRVDEDFFQP